MDNNFTKSRRTTVKRLPARGAYDRDTIYAILDSAFICHIGFVADGQPFVIPTSFARVDDVLYIHGSAASRMLRTLAGGVDMCVTVTHVDGLVLARSAFHHSINYRSAVVLGKAVLVDEPEEKDLALHAITEHIIPGRWPEIRWPNEIELKATSVLRLAINEASAKLRTGEPKDDEEDYLMDIWAGVLPLSVVPGTPIPDERVPEGIQVPDHVLSYKK